ncbi:MAG: S8 family serine peptidase [Planctomycetota bacterium]
MEEGYSGLDSDVGSGVDSAATTTGRKIVTILSDDARDKKKVLDYFAARDVQDVLQSADFTESAYCPDQASNSEAVVFDHLPILSLNDNQNVQSALMAEPANHADDDVRRLFVVEDEQWYFPSCPEFGGLDDGVESESDPGPAPNNGLGLSEYQRGYLRGIQMLATNLLGGVGDTVGSLEGGSMEATSFGRCFDDTNASTWGLQATRVSNSALTGHGIRVAILDTGFEFGHSDSNFASRVVGRVSTVGGTAQDHHGHGTHVAGTACGPRVPGLGTRRYGVATESEILVAKVLGRQGGTDTQILGGLNWAIGQRCDLINLSLGPRACRPMPAFSASFERVARLALRLGVLMIAAAGNNSRRPGLRCPVSGPSAAPSIVAVAALDHCGRVAPFSNEGQNTTGGEINFAAPGVGVFSSWTNPTRHRSIQGTSMAAPHVTGIAALIAQQTGLRGLALYRELRLRAREIGLPRSDAGNGLAQV